jgi:chorismate dehydratase
LKHERGLREVKKLRISIVEYLNTAPLVWGFTDGPLAGKYDLSFHVPSQCAESLRRGDVDIAIIPSIEYQRIDNVVALPGLAIAAKGEVRSLLVVSQRPIQRAKKIALDTSSRATQALVRILCAEHWGIEPEFVQAAPDPAEMLRTADAGLVIGDPALRIAMKMEALDAKTQRERVPGEEACCQGDPEEMPVPGFETVFVYDVAYQWRELTGKPCVLAIWAGRADAITPEVIADFEASKRYGIERMREISEAASIKLDLPPRPLERYLTENIQYDLAGEYLEGLKLYYEKAARLGIIPANKPLVFAGDSAGESSSAQNREVLRAQSRR